MTALLIVNAALALGGASMLAVAGALTLRSQLRVAAARRMERFRVMVEQRVACRCGAEWTAVHPLAERLMCPACGAAVRPPQVALTERQARALVELESDE